MGNVFCSAMLGAFLENGEPLKSKELRHARDPFVVPSLLFMPLGAIRGAACC